ncbi:MAG: metallophosphoesterase [Candidatus Eisenbacteria bacterium]
MKRFSALLAVLSVVSPVFARPIGDTLTVIMRPILGLPAFCAAGETLDVVASAPPSAAGWSVELLRAPRAFPLAVSIASRDKVTQLWTLRVPVPSEVPEELYDLAVHATGGIADTTLRAVKVLAEYEDQWYFAQVTDTHLPGHKYYGSRGWEADSTEEADFRAVIDDLNLIAPEFVLLTGDFINEGELEDQNEYRAYSRAQRVLLELEVPVFLIAGNHDIGGWTTTPPPDGTARRNWWRFFGWPHLDDPPDGVTTQDYFFDYGPVRFVGLESYYNYDGWRRATYGSTSFRSHQLDFLRAAVAGRPRGGGGPSPSITTTSPARSAIRPGGESISSCSDTSIGTPGRLRARGRRSRPKRARTGTALTGSSG